MTGTGSKIDRELLGRVAALTPGQQRWLRTVLQSIATIDAPPRRRADEEPQARPRPRRASAPPAKEPRRQRLDDLLAGEDVSEEEYPELADELKGIADIADLLREGGRERRRFGEELMRLFEGSEGGSSPDEEEDERASFN